MPAVDSTIPGNSFNTLDIQSGYPLVALNEILRETLKKAQADIDHLQLIVRCENLPFVKANYDEAVQLFDDLLGMILKHSPGSARLFLYIDCEEDTTDIIDMMQDAGFKRFNIKFHTNITTHEHWKLMNSHLLIRCRQTLARFNGSLVVNDISNAGCLFSVSLPGKTE